MPGKILLADDSVTIQKVVSLILADTEYELVSVSDGNSAIEKIHEINPDMVIVDAAMPGKNGYEVCKYVKDTPSLKHIPVLLLTGTFEPINEDEAKKAGVDDSIVKPFDSQELIDKITNLFLHPKMNEIDIDDTPIIEPLEEIIEDVGEGEGEGIFSGQTFKDAGFEEGESPKRGDLVEKTVEKTVEDMAKKIIPQITERVIREEIERIRDLILKAIR